MLLCDCQSFIKESYLLTYLLTYLFGGDVKRCSAQLSSAVG